MHFDALVATRKGSFEWGRYLYWSSPRKPSESLTQMQCGALPMWGHIEKLGKEK